jgi:NDP-sugar pyrophosphorylase family protein/drug/metabolite transporter (DMT)-like permease
MTEVCELDFRALARATGCSPNELLTAVHRGHSSFSTAGAVAAPEEQVSFVLAQQASAAAHEEGIRVALISLASRPGELDRKQLPKCLTPVGNQPLISHVLTQLHAGGISQFVIVIGAHGELIRKAIHALPIARRVMLRFVDLGATYAAGFARSLLAASPLLSRPAEHFLLCTPDHIFDASIVSEMRTAACRPELEAVALVESNARSLTGTLPPTAVRVRLAELSRSDRWPAKFVTEIGTQLPGATAIEAGLYRCSGAVFAHLAQLCADKDYVTLAEAMQQLAVQRRLGAMMTNGKRWIALETVDQMESTINSAVGSDGRARFPWQVHRVTAARVEEAAALSVPADQMGHAHTIDMPDEQCSPTRRLVIPLASDPRAADLMPAPSHEQRDFVVVPSSLTSSFAFTDPTTSGGATGGRATLQEPLLFGAEAAALSVEASLVNAAVGSVSTDLSALSIEMRSGAGTAGPPLLGATSPQRPAYMIALPPQHDAAMGRRHLLALPAPPVELEDPLVCPSPLPVLPSAIESVTLRATEEAVTLTVHKTVPLTGWLLLGTALLTCYSGAPATDLQLVWQPSRGSHTFLRCVWRGTASSLLAGLVACAYPSSRTHLVAALRLRLTPATARLLFSSGLAFFTNFGAFNLALAHTSISHAALFESCSSIYIVVAQLLAALLGRASGVPKLQLYGVVLGCIGALLTTRDGSPDTAAVTASSGVPVSVLGDVVALASGLGAAFYLSLAEAIRVDIDPIAFFCLVMMQFAVLSLAAAHVFDDAPPSFTAPFDEETGILGWMLPSPARLPVQLWLALVVDLAGNLGFIAVMKFVPAITVAAAMLLGPLVSTVEGIAVGVDELPGGWTLAGGLLITVGSGLISYAVSESTATVEIRGSSFTS